MVCVPINIVKAGMRVSQPVFINNAKLVNKDSILDDKTLERIRRAGVTKVYIYDDQIDPALVPDSPQSVYNQVVKLLTDIRLKALTEDNFDINRVNRLMQKLSDLIAEKYRPFTEMVRAKNSGLSVMEHMVDVCFLSAAFAKILGMPSYEIKSVAIAGLFHDIGKFFIPESTLKLAKLGQLTDEDQFLFMKHTTLGHDFLAGIQGVANDTLEVVAQHHERVDGSGYPYGLTQERIHKYAQMISIADTYANQLGEQPDGTKLLGYEIAELMGIQAGYKLDKDLVERFMSDIVTYPLQSKVRLNTGEVATVVLQNKNFPMRPFVKIGSRKVDLSQELTIFVERIIEQPKDNPDDIIY